ncbi:hypothetical protein LAZ67_13000104 [Cordylochernes scorpioides]|uniref:RNA-directed DNA polymerase n=1 Tax=Cordylochernes scorpioides TaxID=51811 RepID=A0ABY6L7H5_9ARAC|nr:hypothetical protein LAZ67_13000104 [Cordylochernes scorpioides]
MLKDISEFVKTCHLCQSRKGSNHLPSGLLQPIPPANHPFERIGIDFVGPLPSTKRRRKWIIVLTDYYTKYAETKAVLEATMKEVSTFLIEHIILRHGAPRFLISDRGSQFTSNLMKEVMKMCKVKHGFTTSYNPQTNGLTEWLNRTLINMISMYVNTDQKNWDKILPFITHALLSFFLLFGREPMSLLDDENIPTDSNMDDYDQYIENYLDKIARTRQVVINNTEKTQERMKRNYDKKHNDKIYEPGHLVAVWTPKLSNVNYLIEPKDNPGQDPLIVHVSRLKLYFERIDEHRMSIANEMLDSVRDDPNLLQRVITGDESWVYGYDVETKAQSSQWKLLHEPRPKKARQVRGVVHHEFLPQGRTVNKEYYLQVMCNLCEAIRQKRPDLWKNKNRLLHHDNAPAHTSLLVRKFLAKNNTLMMPQPPYSPDLAPCDFFLFPKLKRPMKGRLVTIRPYRVPICDQREIRSQIRQMLDNDIIEPSYSPFSSPVTLVTKRDKTKRFCIDYRKVNEVISSDVHPLPRIEDILDRLARAKYFSTADVSSAYWQVPIHPDSRPLLAFATIDGLYQPTRLPFGLKTSPQIYERAINQVLQGHGLDCVAHYFDDFVIYSETLEEHQEHLRRFFAFCDAENLQLNLTKCEFFRQTIEFLGYTITAGTTTPLIRNTDVIHAIPPPNNRKTLQSFLGAVNVYNKFIPDYARLRTPLNNLLKKDVTWDWDDKCQKAFTSLKESLTQHPVLHLYKDELPCQVYCDASTLGIAGVLKQVHSAGKAYPVQYFSRALRVHERNYTISELECLAIVESVEKFRVYLMGRKFTIFSDHHALQWLKTIKNPSGRLFRWSLRLSCYEYEVRYIKGSLQHEADLLSRNPFCGFLDASIIKNHQLTPSGESKLTIDRNGLQTLKRRGVTKIVVPDALVPDLLTKVHSRYNHPGISQMTRLISPQYYWKGMSEDISKTTKACAICQSTKPPRGPTFGELGQLPVATQPFDLVALDTIAGLAKYGNAKTYLHVVVDHFSRYTWTFPSKSTSLTTYQQVIKRVLQDGSPKRLLTDRAPAFTSPKFRKFLINRNIHPLLTTSNNPQANGLCERLNATLTGKLRLLHLENPKAAWTKLAKRVTVVYNNTPHSVTGFPPGYLMFGVLPPELTEHVNPYPVLTTARRIAHERTQAKHLKDKHAYDQQHKTPHFEPGDLVLVKVYHHPNTGKLAPYFTGPYEILEIISPNVVRINRPNQPLNRNTDTVHMKDRRLYDQKHTPVYYQKDNLVKSHPKSRTLRKATEEILGPYKVTKKLSEVTYEVEPVDRSRKAKDIVHVIWMKPYLDPEEQHSILLGNTSRDRLPSRTRAETS